jgi:pimeloyl-ACP methyl ester carboxylesterase
MNFRSCRAILLTSTLAFASASCVVAAPSSRPAGKYADVNGIHMYYETRGAGSVLVLLHGGGGSGEQFGHQVPAFEKRFRLILPDMCAQGRTNDRSASLSYHAMAEDVIALMNKLGVKRFDVMGWSDGGITGLDIAIHHPDRIRRLVTFGANFSPDGYNPADLAFLDTATVSGFGDGMRQGWMEHSPEPGHYEVAMQKLLTMWKTQPNFTPAELHSIRANVMVCVGENDLIRPEHTRELAKAIPHATLWIVPGASHSAMMEKPDQVNARVVEFLTH